MKKDRKDLFINTQQTDNSKIVKIHNSKVEGVFQSVLSKKKFIWMTLLKDSKQNKPKKIVNFPR